MRNLLWLVLWPLALLALLPLVKLRRVSFLGVLVLATVTAGCSAVRPVQEVREFGRSEAPPEEEASLPAWFGQEEREVYPTQTFSNGTQVNVVRYWNPECPSMIGSVVFSVTWFGTGNMPGGNPKPYWAGQGSWDPDSAATMFGMVDDCWEAIEFTWQDVPPDRAGWQVRGAGFRSSREVMANEVVPWIRSIMTGSVLCWTGDSGGGIQGAGALCEGAQIEVLVLGGGPPVVDQNLFCANEFAQGGTEPLVDFAMGWTSDWPPTAQVCSERALTSAEQSAMSADDLLGDCDNVVFLPQFVAFRQGDPDGRDAEQASLLEVELEAMDIDVDHQTVVPDHNVSTNSTGAPIMAQLLRDNCQSPPGPPVCGDGLLNQPGIEYCDDGNTTDGDGCSANCFIEIDCSPPGEGEVCWP